MSARSVVGQLRDPLAHLVVERELAFRRGERDREGGELLRERADVEDARRRDRHVALEIGHAVAALVGDAAVTEHGQRAAGRTRCRRRRRTPRRRRASTPADARLTRPRSEAQRTRQRRIVRIFIASPPGVRRDYSARMRAVILVAVTLAALGAVPADSQSVPAEPRHQAHPRRIVEVRDDGACRVQDPPSAGHGEDRRHAVRVVGRDQGADASACRSRSTATTAMPARAPGICSRST